MSIENFLLWVRMFYSYSLVCIGERGVRRIDRRRKEELEEIEGKWEVRGNK